MKAEEIQIEKDLPMRYTLNEELSFAGQTPVQVWATLLTLGEAAQDKNLTMGYLLANWNSSVPTGKLGLKGAHYHYTYTQFMKYLEKESDKYAGFLVEERRRQKHDILLKLRTLRNQVQHLINDVIDTEEEYFR